MKRFLALCFPLFCSVCVFADAKVILVGSKPDHPYATHMYEFDCKLLVTCLKKNKGIEATFVRNWPPTDKLLAETNAIVFYSSPSGSVLLAPKHRKQFAMLLERGVGFVAIHWGTGVGYGALSEPQESRDLFQGWLGGWFRRPPSDIHIGRSDLKLVDRDHPIGRGWTVWNIHDEFYLNPVLHKNARPLLKVDVDGKEHVVGWTFDRGPGRSVGITLGHFHHNFARDDFRRLVVNGILWSAKERVPKNGAIVEVDASDVALPKRP